MFKLMFNLFKFVAFIALILGLGSWVRWGDRTISDHVAMGLSQARHLSLPPIGESATDLTRRTRESISKISFGGGLKSDRRQEPESHEDIQESERQKLRDLIRELNGARKR